MKPLQTGITLSLTLIVFYSLCTLVWVAWTNQFMNFMNSLFHGLDFRKLMTQEPYEWSSFFYSIIVFAIWGFGVGVFFAWLHNILSREGRH